ncbi:hypothetical protein T4D_11155 [Trichinella pseudospiralis]|uniref:Uncharacterized protein n=1 Tax=Trichinella pseudospiralis TaxID=6337 RepID=A0A0V1F942_TRIPS|nr:hypothetical protein T4D_11155 [Trichinella pseudospiralis]
MVHTYMEKLMKQKKVKARMTPSKSWTIHRLKRDEKRRIANLLKPLLTLCALCRFIKNVNIYRKSSFH